jgi:colanic acid biosynthesis glycosyl transferase WcaI
MASILILSLVFPPDQVSTAQIMGDIASDLTEHGHHVTVISTIPHYNPPSGEHAPILQKHWDSLVQKSRFNGVDVLHTYMMRKRRGILSRAASYLLFHFLSLLVGLFAVEKPDIIIAPSPPLTIALCEWLLALRYKVPFVYIVQEIYPDIAIDMGVIRNRLLIRLLYAIESFVHARVSKLIAITEQMRQRLIQKGVPPAKVTTIPNFVNTEALQPMPKRNDFSVHNQIHDKFVVSYAGNLGPAQSLGDFMKAADTLKGDPSIQFLLLGDGILREELKSQAANLGLSNMLILPYQPYALMQQIYAASDLNLVPQSAETGATSMPSKVYRIMSCARPVLVYADPTSELASLVNEISCGIAVPIGKPDDLARAIRDAAKKEKALAKMGENGRRHVQERYAREVVTAQYHKLIGELVAASAG